ncbi:hypothetical protein V6U90_20965 [Micromonospora sp. CPCC 206060]|uniref:orotate phosphoribosyltransferase n=1 Tax=Micromonospora sp. CPCC 206060 TaxID=3122406 RepID=UPI002FF209DB
MDTGTNRRNMFQSRHQRWTELARDLRAAACLPGEFMLDANEPVDTYIDVVLFETRPTILRRMAALLADLVDATADRLAARTQVMPLVTALSLETGLPFAMIRSLEDGGGSRVEGELHAGERVILVEDVIVSGAHTAVAVRALRDLGAVVPGVLAAVDRSRGRSHTAANCPVQALYTPLDLQIPDQARSRARTDASQATA